MSDLLNSTAARDDLTDRECAKLIGALLGGLAQMAPAAELARAVKWWADHPQAIAALYDGLGSDWRFAAGGEQ